MRTLVNTTSTYLTGITGFEAFTLNPGIVVDGGGITNVSKIIVLYISS